MSGIRRQHSRDFKISLIRSIEAGKPLAQVARENNIHPGLITKWIKDYADDPENAFKGNGKPYKEEAMMAELERTIGRLYVENDFLKKALKALETRIQEEKKRAGRM